MRKNLKVGVDLMDQEHALEFSLLETLVQLTAQSDGPGAGDCPEH